MFDFVTRLFKPQSPKFCTIEGYWCKTPINPDAQSVTAFGGKVNAVTVMVDVDYLIVGEQVKVQGVRLSRKSPNVAAVKRSETWHATSVCTAGELAGAIGTDLEDASGFLRKAMFARWRDTFGKSAARARPRTA